MNVQPEWDEEMIAEVLANPCYAGIGPYPAIVDDDTWARCTARRMQEEGPEEAIVFTLQVFESTFPGLTAPDAAEYVDLAQESPHRAALSLLADLRVLADALPIDDVLCC
jgi:hypothetical protein